MKEQAAVYIYSLWERARMFWHRPVRHCSTVKGALIGKVSTSQLVMDLPVCISEEANLATLVTAFLSIVICFYSCLNFIRKGAVMLPLMLFLGFIWLRIIKVPLLGTTSRSCQYDATDALYHQLVPCSEGYGSSQHNSNKSQLHVPRR